MKIKLDPLDQKILTELQHDASQSLEKLAAKISSSKTPVWNRIRRLYDRGVIKRQIILLDPQKLGLEMCFFVLVRTSEHGKSWNDNFLKVIKARPEVLEAHRLAGDIDYILKLRLPNAKAYDRFYQAIISDIKIFNITALLSMEEIKSTHFLTIQS